MLKYHEPEPLSKEMALRVFASGDSSEICHTLVATAFYEDDWQWVQNICLGFLRNEDPDIRGLAATCLGHIARIHRKLEKSRVLIALIPLLKDADTSVVAKVEDAISDITWFMPGKRNRRPKRW